MSESENENDTDTTGKNGSKRQLTEKHHESAAAMAALAAANFAVSAVTTMWQRVVASLLQEQVSDAQQKITELTEKGSARLWKLQREAEQNGEDYC